MGSLIDALPIPKSAKLGAKFFNDNKGKVDQVIKATKLSEKQLRNPAELKKAFGVPTAGDVGSVTVDIPAFNKKFGLTMTIIDYNKLLAGIKKQIEWFEAVDRYDPTSEIKKRKKLVYKSYIDYSATAFKNGKDDKKAIKQGEAALKQISPFMHELNELGGYYAACRGVYPRQQKVFAAYENTFFTAATMLLDVGSSVLLHPSYQVAAMTHYQACKSLGSACSDAEKLCKKIGKEAKSKEELAKGTRNIFGSAVVHIGESVAPAKLKEAEKAIKEAIKPATGLLGKLFGA